MVEIACIECGNLFERTHNAQKRCGAKCRKRAKKKHNLNSLMRWRYGISLSDYDRMFRLQGGVCAICFSADPKGRGRFCVDHNHETGEIRGLLCHHCNSGIGMLGDDLDTVEAAARYLRSYES